MKNVLITGARAPSALELARSLSGAGHTVYAADCLRFPLARFSTHVAGFIKYPSPRYALAKFRVELLEIVQVFEIDLVIPTCEEIFYLGALKGEIECHCPVFCEGLAVLAMLHNKATFQACARENGLSALETEIVEKGAVGSLSKKLPQDKRYVAKPVYSRFGDKAVLDVQARELEHHLQENLYPWAVQEFIAGEEYCAYAICVGGRVCFHACYTPAFRAGQGSSFYFQPALHTAITQEIVRFVKNIGYSGQIGFDFIERNDGKLFVLECNPRCTSGVHFLPDQFDWATLFPGEKNPAPQGIEAMEAPKMVGLAMLVYGLRKPNSKGLRAYLDDCRRATDVIARHGDWLPVVGQFIALLEIAVSAVVKGISLKDASTMDIEWDGQPIK